MATARSAQTHQKRVQKIAEEAADKIAAEAPYDEEVIVVVEELPPGQSSRTQRGQSAQAQPDTGDVALGMISQSQKFFADAMSNWANVVSAPFAGSTPSLDMSSGLFDPRRIVQESFRLAEELLASQKEFALKVAEAMTPAKAA